MFIPINTEEGNLGLSVIRTKNGYSVAIMETCNPTLIPLKSYYWYYNNPEPDDDYFECVVSATDYKIIEGENLYECIEKCLQQIFD